MQPIGRGTYDWYGRRKNFTRAERQAMITTVFAIAIQNQEKEWLTPYELSKRIGMTNAPGFRSILQGMCFKGQLIWRDIEKPGRWPGKEYTLMPGTYSRPHRRTISLKIGNQPRQEVIF